MLVAAPLVAAQGAAAQPPYPPGSVVTVSDTTVTAGGSVDFGTPPGIFDPGTTITVLLESDPIVLGQFRVNEDGSVSGTVTIPATAPSGWHVLRLTSGDRSVGVTIFVMGGTTSTPTPTPTPTKSPTHRPTHKPGHPGKPGHHDQHDGGHNGSHGRGAAADPADYQHHDQHQHPAHNGRSLAATGNDKALALGGTAAALFVAGGGTMLAVRRRRSS
ncbi:hypothetical protein [Streptomyces sp. NPDC093984]|uniref:hypothetical protein n=1 Tax=Streptomyces sp. NPDC093984 TaxID=3366052 RepID=UPI0037F67109